MTVIGDRPIFIVCCPRSGSTLLRLILDSHPRLAVPPPAWLFHYIYPYLYSYGDLGVEENVRALIEDALKTPAIEGWPIDPKVEEVREEMRTASFAEMYAAFHRIYARPKGKERWGEKTPRDCFYMADIKEMYPDAQFIHILRDGRDSAIDISDSILWPNGLYAAAQMWRQFVEAAEEESKALGAEACITVKYEDLCTDPEATIQRLCSFLGEEFAPQMLAHHETESTRQWAQAPVHAKTVRPINTDYVGMYKNRLRPGDRAVLDGLIGSMLRETGYPVEGESMKLSRRDKQKILENDTLSNPKAIDYKRWHEARRKERRELGVWKDSDKESDLLGFI